jgi:hypothetical protein
MQVSNRRASLTSSNFLRPSRVPGGQPLGDQSSPFQGNQDEFSPEFAERYLKDIEAGKDPEEELAKRDERDAERRVSSAGRRWLKRGEV